MSSEHLSAQLAKDIAAGQHKPLNPHSQKLLAAAARKPKIPAPLENEGTGKKPKRGTEAQPKAKGKAKAKAKPTKEAAEAKTKKKKAQVSVKAAAPQQANREDARVKYMTAKNKFLKTLLDTLRGS